MPLSIAFSQPAHVNGFHDRAHRVLALYGGFALDLQSELPDVRATQVIEKAGADERVLRAGQRSAAC